MDSSARSLVGVGVGLAGAAFLGYCVYFDRQRRSAPDYKEKVRARRARGRAAGGGGGGGGSGGGMGGGMGMGMGGMGAGPGNAQDMQAFFMQEVQLGEELMGAGNVEEGAEHLSNAVCLCGQPQALLQILQQTLPPQHFAALISKLPQAKARMQAAAAAAGMPGMPGTGESGGESGPIVEEAEDDSATPANQLQDEEMD